MLRPIRSFGKLRSDLFVFLALCTSRTSPCGRVGGVPVGKITDLMALLSAEGALFGIVKRGCGRVRHPVEKRGAVMKSKVLGCLLAAVLVLTASSCLSGETVRPQSTNAPLGSVPRQAATLSPSPIADKGYAALDAAAVPPGDGLYLAVEGRPVELQGMPFLGLPDERQNWAQADYAIGVESLTGAPSTQNRMPVVLFQAPADGEVAPANLGLYHLEIGMGIQYSSQNQQCMVDDVQQGSGASDAGVSWGDIVLSVNGQECGGSCDRVVELSAGEPLDTVRLTLLRGTRNIDVSVPRRTVIGYEVVPFTVTAKGEYVQLVPRATLEPGLYCFAYQTLLTGVLNGWRVMVHAFWVE